MEEVIKVMLDVAVSSAGGSVVGKCKGSGGVNDVGDGIHCAAEELCQLNSPHQEIQIKPNEGFRVVRVWRYEK